MNSREKILNQRETVRKNIYDSFEKGVYKDNEDNRRLHRVGLQYGEDTSTKLKSNLNFRKLSAYTIAENCSDITDLKDGIKEVKKYLDDCSKEGRVPPPSAYIRLHKLVQKLEKLEKDN